MRNSIMLIGEDDGTINTLCPIWNIIEIAIEDNLS